LGYGRALRIRVANKSAERTPVSGNRGENSLCVALKPEDAARQIFRKHSFGCRKQCLPCLPLGEQLNSTRDFCLGDGLSQRVPLLVLPQPADIGVLCSAWKSG
jgi:hypothetical protein